MPAKMRFSYNAILFATALIAQAVFGGEPASVHPAAKAPSRIELAQAPDTVPPAALPDLLARAEALSRSGKPAEAYELLLSAEDTYIGTVEFDYALGRAALDAGRPDKATLAFTRVLALDPAHAGASIDMGRAYIALGDFTRARSTFQGLLSLDPPPQVRAQLQAFLDLTEASAAASPAYAASGGLSHQGFLAALLGRSSNVNQAPSQSVIFVPGVGSNFQLPGQNVQKPDSFAGIGGGVDLTQYLDDTYSMIFGGEFLGRRNFHEFDFDIGGYNLYLGLAAVSGPHAARIQKFVGRDYLGGSANRDLDGFTLGYVGTLNAATQLMATVQTGRQRFVPEELKIFDADYAVLGTGAARKLDERSTVFAVLSTGHQKDIGGSPSGNKDLVGFQAGGEMLIGTRIKATAAAVGERSRYDKFDPGFETERRDIRRAFDLGAQYYFERNLSLRFNVSYAYTSSNIPIYEYTRVEGTLMLRRDFR
jgi:tetratricopeptide (TPR) repeat protein